MDPPVPEEIDNNFSLSRLDPDFSLGPDGRRTHPDKETSDHLTIELLKDKRWDLKLTAVQNLRNFASNVGLPFREKMGDCPTRRDMAWNTCDEYSKKPYSKCDRCISIHRLSHHARGGVQRIYDAPVTYRYLYIYIYIYLYTYHAQHHFYLKQSETN